MHWERRGSVKEGMTVEKRGRRGGQGIGDLSLKRDCVKEINVWNLEGRSLLYRKNSWKGDGTPTPPQ